MADRDTALVQDIRAENLLSGIYSFIQSQQKTSQSYEKASSESLNDINDSIASSLREASLDRKSRDKNSRAVDKALKGIIKDNKNYYKDDKKDRATQAVLFRKIEKNVSILNKVFNVLNQLKDSLINIVVKNLQRSLTYYADMSKIMRIQLLTSSQKKKIGVAADQTALDVSGMFDINVAKDDIAEFYKELIAGGKDLELMEDKQRAAYAALRQSGIDDSRAYTLAMTGNMEEIKKTVTAMVDPKTKAIINSTINSMSDLTMAQMGVNDVMRQSVEAAQSMQSSVGAAGIESAQKQINNMFLKQTNQLKEYDATLALTTGTINSTSKTIGKDYENTAKRMSKGTLLAIGSIDGMAEAANDIAKVKIFQNTGVDTNMRLRTSEENKEALSENTKYGKLQDWSDKLMSWVNINTGGAITSLSNTIDKYFGDSADINQIVSGGFGIVKGLLETLIISSTVSGGFLKGLPGKIGSLLPKILPKALTSLKALGTGGAITAAVGSLTFAVSEIKGTIDKYRDVDKAKESLKDNQKNIESYKQALDAAKKKGNKELEAKYAGLLKQAEEAIPELQNKLSEAEFNALSKSEQAYVKLSEDNQKIRSANIKEMNDLQRLGLTDSDRYKELKRQNEEMFENERIVGEESRNLVSSLFRLDVDQMIAWHNFKESFSKFFKEDIKNFFKGVGEWWSELGSSISSWFTNKVDQAANFINKNIITPIKNAFPSLIDLAINFVSEKINDLITTIQEYARPVIDWIGKFIEDAKEYLNPTIENFKSNFIEPIKELLNFDWLPGPVKKLLGLSGSSEDEDYGFGDMASDLVYESSKAISESLKNISNSFDDWFNGFKLFGDGGVVDSATKAIVGESGKEAILPLTKKGELQSVLNSLTPSEKLTLIKALIGSGDINQGYLFSAVNDILFNRSNIKSNTANTLYENIPSEPSALANKIIEGAAAQKGHSYAEMVCNQMVEAALKYAGFTPPTTGIVTKHFHHPKMKIVLNDPINGISPTNRALVPGMIMFSHPFTQAEADNLNRKKGGKRLAGDPGHMGIYAGNGLWWNSTSSKSTIDYSSGKGIQVTDYNKGFGVALTKPFTKGTYKLYAAGYYDGMLDNTAVNSLPSSSPNIANSAAMSSDQFVGPRIDDVKNTLKEQLSANSDLSGSASIEEISSFSQFSSLSKLAELAMSALSTSADVSSKQVIMDYAKQASTLLNASNSKEILAALMLIAKNTSAMASSSKKSITPVSKVPNASFM